MALSVTTRRKKQRPNNGEELPAIPDTGNLGTVVDELYYCCGVVLDQQLRMDRDMAKLKAYTRSLHDFIKNLSSSVLSLSSSSDQMDAKLVTHTERLDAMDKSIAGLSADRVEGLIKVTNDLQAIRSDIDGLANKISAIQLDL
jgi:uncharacterized coiled-coil protein SlyX